MGLVAFGAVLYFSGLERLPVLLEAQPRYVLLALAALIAVTTVSALRWGMIVNSLAGRPVLSFGGYYAALLTSRVLGLFISRSGSDLGVRFGAVTGARRAGGSVAAASLFLDQMFDLALLLAWIGPALLILTDAVSGPPAVGLLVVASVVAFVAMMGMHRLLAAAVTALGWLLDATSRLPLADRLQRFLDARRRNVAGLLDVEGLSRPRLAALATLTMVRYALNALMFFGIAAALDLDVSWMVFVLTGALVQLSLVIAATPGGLGVMDAGWVFSLGLAGVPSEATAVFLVGQRAFQYTGFPALGAVSSLLLVRGARTPDEVGDQLPDEDTPQAAGEAGGATTTTKA